MTTIGHNSDAVGAEALREYVERIEAHERDIAAAQEERKLVYDELKGDGFDAKAVRAIVKARKQDPSAREAHEALVDIYRNALGL